MNCQYCNKPLPVKNFVWVQCPNCGSAPLRTMTALDTTSELRQKIEEAAMYGFIEGAYDVHGIPVQSIDKLEALFTAQRQRWEVAARKGAIMPTNEYGQPTDSKGNVLTQSQVIEAELEPILDDFEVPVINRTPMLHTLAALVLKHRHDVYFAAYRDGLEQGRKEAQAMLDSSEEE